MDNRKYESYAETHKKLVEAMQKACVHDDFDDYKTPYIDLSFLEEEYTTAVEMPDKKRFSFANHFNNIAAILVILLLGGNMIMMATDSNESYGDKGLLHRLSNTITGVVTDGDNPVGTDEIIEEHIITSSDGIVEITKRFPDLYIPEYLPDGFELDVLSISFFDSGDCRAKYEYICDNDILCIGISYTSDSKESLFLSSTSELEVLEMQDRIIYLYKDIEKERYIADVYFEDCNVDISGLNNKNELLYVAQSLNKIIKKVH